MFLRGVFCHRGRAEGAILCVSGEIVEREGCQQQQGRGRVAARRKCKVTRARVLNVCC